MFLGKLILNLVSYILRTGEKDIAKQELEKNDQHHKDQSTKKIAHLEEQKDLQTAKY